MCGILGLFSNKIDTNRFHKSLEVMGHRGPDDCGVDRLTPDLILDIKDYLFKI